MTRGWKGLVLAVAAFACGALILSTILFATNSDEIGSAATQREAIIDAQVKACERDHDFRIQARIRAEVERHILRQFIGLIAISPVFHENPVESQKVIDKFERDLGRIHILPLPDCEQVRDELENP